MFSGRVDRDGEAESGRQETGRLGRNRLRAAIGTVRIWAAALGLLVLGLPVDLRASADNAVLAWNALMLDAIRGETTGPTLSTRNLAILHAAIFDAVNSVDRGHQPYRFQFDAPPGTSAAAAAASAGRVVMRVLYPSMDGATERRYGELLEGLAESAATTQGIELGFEMAAALLNSRMSDGSSTAVPYIPSTEPGQWLRTPPFYRPPMDPHWRYVELFCLEDKEPYVVPGPPGLDSAEYAQAFEEVQSLGAAYSSVRSQEEGDIAIFWSDFSYTAMPPGHWHEIAASIARERQSSLVESARLMAWLSLVQADAAIVCWEGKYRHNFWRPVTAIRRADEDGNGATAADGEWDHFLVSPNFPEYPSGHSTFSKASAQVLTRFFETDAITFAVRSDSLPGVTRHFESLAACADEIGMSRIYGGIHFQFSNRDGKASGLKIAEAVCSNYLMPVSSLPDLRIEGLEAGRARLRVHGLFAREYAVEASPDLTNWSEIASVTGTPGGMVCYDRPDGPAPHRFYRATLRLEPGRRKQ
ncbi:MAG: vanadium-dependent haloperoxidase [Verrucomicrobia bacterium]|nr:vanadium-dependent haloperoxidase [Verrucomicrobiota bacterium]